MKVVGQILLARILLAAMQSIVAGLMVFCLLTFLWGAIFRPRQTLGTVGMLVLLELIGSYSVASIVVAGLAFVVVKLRRRGSDGATDPAAAPSPTLLPGRAREAAGGDFGGGDG